jgi:hypothetical protein
MRRGGVAVAVVCVVTAALAFTGPASASTLVGNGCAAQKIGENATVVSLKNPLGSPLPGAIPSAGVITSWTYGLGLPIGAGVQVYAKLKVFAPTAAPDQFKVVGESGRTQIGTGTTASTTRVPVQSGDLLGSSILITGGNESVEAATFCETGNPEDEGALVPGDPTSGSIVLATPKAGIQNPVTVTVEPDADGDGFGDETQDQCPTDATTQGPCPVKTVAPPPTPPAITLSASAAARKSLVTVSLTTTAQATVTVGGTVKLGKGKSAKLTGGTQLVAAGSLAQFTVVFPAKLTAALKQTPKNKKLTLTLSASAPGATSTNLTVKVPGQQKPARKHHQA